MVIMMFSSLVWAPITAKSVSHTLSKAEFHKQVNTEFSGLISTFAIEETEEEEFSEEDNFTFQAAFNFISSFSTLQQSFILYSFSFFENKDLNEAPKIFLQIRSILI